MESCAEKKTYAVEIEVKRFQTIFIFVIPFQNALLFIHYILQVIQHTQGQEV